MRDWFGLHPIRIAGSVFGLGGAAFIFCGHRVAHNSIEFSLFRDRSFSAANAAMFGTVSILPIFQNGYGALGTGYLFIPHGFAARRFVPAALKTR